MFDEGEIINNKSMKMEIVVFLYIRNIEVRPVKSGDDTFHHIPKNIIQSFEQVKSKMLVVFSKLF